MKLTDILGKKQGNWTWRLVPHGRPVQIEGFRNRAETYLWSSLSRKVFICDPARPQMVHTIEFLVRRYASLHRLDLNDDPS